MNMPKTAGAAFLAADGKVPSTAQRHLAELRESLRDVATKWEAETGELFPASIEEWERLAVRTGLPAEKLWGGEWTAREVAPYILGYLDRQWDSQKTTADRSIPAVDRVVTVAAKDSAATLKGVAPRNLWFLQQYEARGTDTYHKPVTIHGKWDSMTPTERATICPDSPNKIAKGTVASGIKRARMKRNGKESTKSKRKPRKKV